MVYTERDRHTFIVRRILIDQETLDRHARNRTIMTHKKNMDQRDANYWDNLFKSSIDKDCLYLCAQIGMTVTNEGLFESFNMKYKKIGAYFIKKEKYRYRRLVTSTILAIAISDFIFILRSSSLSKKMKSLVFDEVMAALLIMYKSNLETLIISFDLASIVVKSNESGYGKGFIGDITQYRDYKLLNEADRGVYFIGLAKMKAYSPSDNIILNKDVVHKLLDQMEMDLKKDMSYVDEVKKSIFDFSAIKP